MEIKEWRQLESASSNASLALRKKNFSNANTTIENIELDSIHRVSIEGTFPYKESYTLSTLWKVFNDMFGMLVHVLGCRKSELVHSFFIFSLDVSYTIFLNKASHVHKRISKQQAR